MKKIEAIVRHHCVEAVKESLRLKGIPGMTVSEARGLGRQKRNRETYRGSEYTVDFLPRARIEICVEDHDLDMTIEAISAGARSGHNGDGMIFVSSVEEVIRIRTAESGSAAL